jgi:hypothetical protein
MDSLLPASDSTDALGLRLPDPNAEKANAHQGKSLEVLLASKNKRILEELTKFRVRHHDHSFFAISDLMGRYRFSTENSKPHL